MFVELQFCMTLPFLPQKGSVFLGAMLCDFIWAIGTSELTGSSWTGSLHLGRQCKLAIKSMLSGVIQIWVPIPVLPFN